jgi:hypothetical protein
MIKEIYRQTDLLRLPPPYVTRLAKLLYLADLERGARFQVSVGIVQVESTLFAIRGEKWNRLAW